MSHELASNNALSQANERQRNLLRGFVGRLSGDSGFQLINVTNVPILLSEISMDNSLVNRVSLVNKLWRHYSWIAFAQVRPASPRSAAALHLSHRPAHHGQCQASTQVHCPLRKALLTAPTSAQPLPPRTLATAPF